MITHIAGVSTPSFWSRAKHLRPVDALVVQPVIVFVLMIAGRSVEVFQCHLHQTLADIFGKSFATPTSCDCFFCCLHFGLWKANRNNVASELRCTSQFKKRNVVLCQVRVVAGVSDPLHNRVSPRVACRTVSDDVTEFRKSCWPFFGVCAMRGWDYPEIGYQRSSTEIIFGCTLIVAN